MIYICIPAYNEAPTIGVILWRIRQVMVEFPRDYQILVVDDASTDATQEVLAPYARVLPLTVLRNQSRQGYAPALERGIREAVRRATHARRDTVVTLQGDFTEAPEDIPALVKRIEGGADVVGIEASEIPSGVSAAMRWTRRSSPWLLRRAALPSQIRDPLSGFRAYRVSVLKKALRGANGNPLLQSNGWAANAELLLAAAPHTDRFDAAVAEPRDPRRQRSTRFRTWLELKNLWDLSRRAPRAAATPVPSTDTNS